MFHGCSSLLLALLLVTLTSSQRAPCYECEEYKDSHPRSSPYEEIRSHCSYPCECPLEAPVCSPGVSLLRDGCGCCAVCARQLGDSCDGTSLCDERRGLVCQYPSAQARQGECQAIKGLPCTVQNRTYDNGETFLLDCRTQCSCQNGTYACSSLCPQESIKPACSHPRLVDVPGQCCREWMCDSVEAERPPECERQTTSWSSCSAETCGLGASRRRSNLNPRCLPQSEGRLCQIRPCGELPNMQQQQILPQWPSAHRIRKGHECKATQRVRAPVHLHVGSCHSKKHYRPKFCGQCSDCCSPQLSTTIKVEFICPNEPLGGAEGLLAIASKPHAGQLWGPHASHRKTQRRRRDISTNIIELNVQWILKCACADSPCPGLLHRVHRTATLHHP